VPGTITTRTNLLIAAGERLDFDFSATSDTTGIVLAAPVTTYPPPGPPPTVSGPIASLFNDGAISMIYGGPANSFLVSIDASTFAGATGTRIVNTGTMQLSAANGSAYGISTGIYFSAIQVVNRGDILISAGASASAILGWGLKLENSGRIEVRGTSAFGIGNATFAGAITNSGLIHVIGSSGAGGITLGSGGGTVVNTGVIDVSVTNPNYGGYGITAEPLTGGVTVVNQGEIHATHAIYMIETGLNRESSYQPFSVNNSGLIDGNIELGAGVNVVINTGTIDGDVWLGASDDSFDGRLGALTGGVDAGSGNDVILGGVGDDLFFGRAGSDTLSGGLGNDILIGGNDADRLIGGSGNDVYDGGYGFDTADFSASTSGVTVNLSTTTAQDTGEGFDRFAGIERLVGSRFDDTLIAAANFRQNDARLVHPASIDNHSQPRAVSLDGLFGLDENQDITDDLVPHVSILSTTTGPAEYYSFTVTNAGARGLFDIDHSGASERIRLSIVDAAGNLIYRLDNPVSPSNDPGSTNALDPYFSVTFAQAGVYYVVVDTTFPSGLTSGYQYTLNVSLEGAPTTSNVLLGSTLEGGEGNDHLIGNTASDTLIGGSGNDILNGLGGNDLLTGGAGSDQLNGGDGIDTAAYAGIRRQYGTANSATVAGGPEGGADTLTSVENARFVDGTLTFDVDSASAQVMRLYDAALGRHYDQAGLEGQAAWIANGTITLRSLADAFVHSAEFLNRFGSLDNRAFVEQLYRFSLGREGEPQGVNGWTANLNAGMSRGDVVIGFSESQEHRGLTQSVLNEGLWVADQQALIIARLYDATFDRLPDSAGLIGWTASLKGGMSASQIASGFADSAEFQSRYGGLSTHDFVAQLFRFCLNREGDAAGIQNWVNNIDAGLRTRAQVLLEFSESQEHINLTTASMLGGVQTFDYHSAPAGVGGDASGKGGLLTLPALIHEDAAGDAFVLSLGTDPIPLVLPADDTTDADGVGHGAASHLALAGLAVAPDHDFALTLSDDPDWAAQHFPARLHDTGHWAPH